MNWYVAISIGIPLIMMLAWILHIAIVWHWDFKAWYHDSDDDI